MISYRRVLFILTFACLGIAVPSHSTIATSLTARLTQVSSSNQKAILPIAPPLLAKADQGSLSKPVWKSPWLLGGIGASSLVGATALVLSRKRRHEGSEELTPREKLLLPEAPSSKDSFVGEAPSDPLEFGKANRTIADSQMASSTSTSDISHSGSLVKEKELVDATGNVVANRSVASDSKATETPVSETTRLAKINIVEELIHELRLPDPAKRQKVIWELGQRGDSRAVQPLVDLMMDSDSRQRSLILSSLSEIGTRTLKPLTRALAISLQDENADVRKNAIRDLTRVYDMVAQISHLLNQATDDPDQDVQETARWALGQLNRIRSTPGREALPTTQNSVSRPESLP
ncbi:MAG: HEAT repeat domain-containing protein [Myxacorys chilensis ATA2-1-KO14]|nr:HEAT repeat domain-containing protein [Myxacorys chilensis ATA2-1-KO14]